MMFLRWCARSGRRVWPFPATASVGLAGRAGAAPVTAQTRTIDLTRRPGATISAPVRSVGRGAELANGKFVFVDEREVAIHLADCSADALRALSRTGSAPGECRRPMEALADGKGGVVLSRPHPSHISCDSNSSAPVPFSPRELPHVPSSHHRRSSARRCALPNPRRAGRCPAEGRTRSRANRHVPRRYLGWERHRAVR